MKCKIRSDMSGSVTPSVSGQQDLFVARQHQPGVRYQHFKSDWIFKVLHSGFHFPTDYPDRRTDNNNNTEVQWTLGAILYKTRFLLLRALQAESLPWPIPAPSWLHLSFLPTDHLQSHCILVVLLAILLYILRLRRVHRRQQWQAEALNLLWANEQRTSFVQNQQLIAGN